MHIPDWQLYIMYTALTLIHALMWIVPIALAIVSAWWLNRKLRRRK